MRSTVGVLAGVLLCGSLAVVGTAAGAARGAQLEIIKTVRPALMIVGAESVYTVTVRNNGDAAATDVTVTDTLDPNVTMGTLPPECTAAGSVVTCGGPGTTIAPSGVLSYEIPVTVDPSLADGTNIRNRASVTSSSAQSQQTQLISQTQTRSDVEIVKTGPATVAPDGTIVYTIVVTNHGPSDAVSVTVQDPTDGNLVKITDLDPACPPSGLTVTCPLGTIAPNASRTLTFTVQPVAGLPEGTTITNCATVYTGGRETDPMNNHSCMSTNVGPVTPPTAKIDVTKSGPFAVRPGDTIAWDVTVTNSGTAASRVILRDVIDDRVTLDPPPSGCVLAGQDLACAIGVLAPGETRTYHLTGTVSAQAAPGGIENCAAATGPTRELVVTDNAACVTTVILTPLIPTSPPTTLPTTPPTTPVTPRPTPTRTVKPHPQPAPKPRPRHTPKHACRSTTGSGAC